MSDVLDLRHISIITRTTSMEIASHAQDREKSLRQRPFAASTLVLLLLLLTNQIELSSSFSPCTLPNFLSTLEDRTTQTRVMIKPTNSLQDDSLEVIDSEIEAYPLLQSRLVNSGLVNSTNDFRFVMDRDWERLESIGADDDEDEKKDNPESKDNDDVLEIKTLVWQVTCYEMSTQYIVTALRMADKVDGSRMRDILFQDMPFDASPRLALAPRDVAERLTGFQSGTMPPICHTEDMKLYVEETIAAMDKNEMVSIGSGVPGCSVFLKLDGLLRIAERSEKGVLVCSFAKETTDFEIGCNDRVPIAEDAIQKQQAALSKQRIRGKDGRLKAKDRLTEYRSLPSYIGRAKLLRTTARKKGRFADVKELVEESVATGDFPQLMKVNPKFGPDKNALHLSAWRGDMETVVLLVETAKQYENLDIVNRVSVGSGNYGKTPIFFALTQCRDDVVRYLLSEGASLLFVNNKGQTPCSIAVTHLKPETCEIMYKVEEGQGGQFANYRQSNSDKKLYGDLDPRFPIDDENMGQDIQTELHAYKKSIANQRLHDGIPTHFSPRSIRQTVRWWKRGDTSLKAANHGSSGEITFTQPRKMTSKKSETTDIIVQERRKLRPETPATSKTSQVNLNSMDLLVLDDVIAAKGNDTDNFVVVDDLNSIRELEKEIDRSIGIVIELKRDNTMVLDRLILDSAWGIDCEWKPRRKFESEYNVATLQLSTSTLAFLVDVQTLCQATSEDRQGEAEVAVLCSVLQKLFQNPDIPLLGYGILQDIGKLAASFSHLPCFSQYSSVIDLQSVSGLIHPEVKKQNLFSLQKMVALLLGKRLNKSEQCSDWSSRPLTGEQVQYATLDAAVLPFLLRTVMTESSTMKMYDGQFFHVHMTSRSSVRYTFLENDSGPGFVHEVPMGCVKEYMSKKVARQCWPTETEPPALPRRQLVAEEPMVQQRNRKMKPCDSTIQKKVKKASRPKPVKLLTIPANLENLPIPGIHLDYTKDSCVKRVVGHNLINSLPEGTYIGFNRRSGVVATTNAWILFLNFGGDSTYGKYSTDFAGGGRHLTFSVNPEKVDERSLFEFISEALEGDAAATPSPKHQILLFARPSTKSKFIFCGLCECSKKTPNDHGHDSVDLLLDLVDFEELVGDERNPPTAFMEMVQARERVFRQLR
jgi:prolyl-tRNA editing enzyme YbaK/EbsC (Cys-tRNA(Pro) deacylase)